MARPTRVLLVDRVTDEREMYAEYLRFAGFEPVECRSGAEALLDASNADVIVTAVRLDESRDGLDLVRTLRGTDATRETPIIVFGGWEGEWARARAAGCDRFLLTPLLPDEFVSEVRRVIAEQHERHVVVQ